MNLSLLSTEKKSVGGDLLDGSQEIFQELRARVALTEDLGWFSSHIERPSGPPQDLPLACSHENILFA